MSALRRLAFLTAAAVLAGGCAALPPGVDFPKTHSIALQDPGDTRLGRTLEHAGAAHPGQSAFRLLPSGRDGLLSRIEMADAAERTLDVQYYIYRQDETSKLVSAALMRAADRGVRVRVLIDDHGAVRKNMVLALDAHPNIEVRLFNPFTYRGESRLLRYVELVVRAPRLKHRMHNKLMVADNSVALVGGRNIGNEYFEASPEFEFGDYDLIAAGPVARELSKSFDEYWNAVLAIPVGVFEDFEGDGKVLDDLRTALALHEQNMRGTRYLEKLPKKEPLRGLLAGRDVHWAHAQVVADRPEKATPEGDGARSWLGHPAVAAATAQTRSEFLLISPYVVPGDEGLHFLLDLRRRNVRVRILTNSLEATDVAVAHAGYARYRPDLLAEGMELYEARATLGGPGGSGTPLASGSSGRFSLHAKALVFDREKVLIGAMNFDKRSLEFNTELGLLVESPALGRQIARQFESIANFENSYEVVLEHNGGESGGRPPLLWRTERDGRLVELEVEPVRSAWQRMTVDFLLALPIDVLLGEADYH